MKQISTHLEQKKDVEEKIEEADTAGEEERGPEERLQDPGEAPLSPGDGPSIRSWSPTPRRVTTSPARAGSERDITTITDRYLKMNEIRGLRKNVTHHPKEPIVT